MNLDEMFRLMNDFRNDVKKLLNFFMKNKNAISDLRDDVKKLINALDTMSKPENMEAFKKFVEELEKFNKNTEKMMKQMEEISKLFK